MKKSKVLIAVLSVSLILIIAAGSSLAYFTASGSAINIITSGKITMILHDETTGGIPFPSEGIKNVMPGNIVDKVVYVENSCKNPEFIRVQLLKSIIAADGSEDTLNFDDIALDINSSEWVDGGDGWYYYTKPLAPGEKTENLMNTVTFGLGLENEYEGCTVHVDVYAEAVQSANNGNSALEASGWPARQPVTDVETTADIETTTSETTSVPSATES